MTDLDELFSLIDRKIPEHHLKAEFLADCKQAIKKLLSETVLEVIGQNEELGADGLRLSDGADMNHKLAEQRQALAELKQELRK